ncbi:hypothetical protein [Erysipelothrix rhusiopathiae]|uniref:hypothetical protein n=1 Tax=Erysipelothrix rhusiopathiae TaxID=1648 RepID=UPI002FBF05E2
MIKTKILISFLKSNTGKKIIKLTAIVAVGLLFLIAIIPVAFIEAINPFKSNPYLTNEIEKGNRRDDVYDKALNEIKQSKNTDELYVNLDMVRIFEYFVVYDTKKELTEVTQEDAKKHLETYYIYQEDKEIKIPKLNDEGEAVIDEETGEALHETKVITIEKAKSLDQIIEDLSVDYPALLNEAYALQIVNIYDFQKILQSDGFMAVEMGNQSQKNVMYITNHLVSIWKVEPIMQLIYQVKEELQLWRFRMVLLKKL